MNPDLFGRNFTLTLTPPERFAMMRPLTPGEWGGQQTFIADIQSRAVVYIDGSGTVDMTDAELHRAERYAYDYGSGGWQAYSRVLVRAGQRAGWRSSRPVEHGT